MLSTSQLYQSYRLANQVKHKLNRTAKNPNPNLRILVTQANLLDRLLDSLSLSVGDSDFSESDSDSETEAEAEVEVKTVSRGLLVVSRSECLPQRLPLHPPLRAPASVSLRADTPNAIVTFYEVDSDSDPESDYSNEDEGYTDLEESTREWEYPRVQPSTANLHMHHTSECHQLPTCLETVDEEPALTYSSGSDTESDSSEPIAYTHEDSTPIEPTAEPKLARQSLGELALAGHSLSL